MRPLPKRMRPAGLPALWWVLASAFLAASVDGLWAATLDVCPSGCAYTSIQAAIDAALPNTTIRVVRGSYAGPFTIAGRSRITLEGGYANSTFTTRDPS